jgi:hypothetical protein
LIALHHGIIKGGHWLPDDRQKWADDLAGIPDGAQVVVSVRKYHKTRSNNQNRYAHGVVFKLIADTTGYSTEEVKDMMRWQFLREEHEFLPPRCRSTTELTTIEFEEFMTNIRQWAAEFLNVQIPLPNEVEL